MYVSSNPTSVVIHCQLIKKTHLVRRLVKVLWEKVQAIVPKSKKSADSTENCCYPTSSKWWSAGACNVIGSFTSKLLVPVLLKQAVFVCFDTDKGTSGRFQRSI